MKPLPVFDDLYNHMQTELQQIGLEIDPAIQAAAGKCICLKYFTQFRERVLSLKNIEKAEEIQLFKEIKPLFAAWLFYYDVLFEFHGRRRRTGERSFRKPIKWLRKQMKKFHKHNHDIVMYCQLGETRFDEQYFLRSNYDCKIKADNTAFDAAFCTSYDDVVAKMIGYEMLEKYVAELETSVAEEGGLEGCAGRKRLNWTAAKAYLGEIIYAFHATKVFNHGKASLSEIASELGTLFNMPIKDIYNVLKDLKARVKTKTPYVDKIYQSMNVMLNEADNPHKY